MFFWYVYILESIKDKKLYIGYTKDLRKRMEEHYKGRSRATKPRKPLVLIYYEAGISQKYAKRREDYLKSSAGRKFLGLRLREYRQGRTALGTRS